MGKSREKRHTQSQLQSYCDSAAKAADELKSVIESMVALQAAGLNSGKSVFVRDSGSIDDAVDIVLKFAGDAYRSLHKAARDEEEATSDGADTDRSKSNKNDKERPEKRTRKEANKMP